jgi:hypothetical protein
MPFSSLRPKKSEVPRCEQNSSIRPIFPSVSRNAENLDAYLRAVRPGDFPRQEGGHPVTPQKVAHAGARSGSDQRFGHFLVHQEDLILPACPLDDNAIHYTDKMVAWSTGPATPI